MYAKRFGEAWGVSADGGACLGIVVQIARSGIQILPSRVGNVVSYN